MSGAFVRDFTGIFIPAGRVIREFNDALIPGTAFAYQPGTSTAWLTADIGSAAFNSGVSSSTNPGQVTIATAGTNNSFARVKTNFVIAGPQYKEIIWTVDGLTCDVDSPIKLFFGISQDGNNGGCDLVQSSAVDALAYVQTTASAATNGTYATNYRLLDGTTYTSIGAARKYKNLTMRLRPQTGEVLILEDDQDMVYANVAATFTNSNSLRAYVMIQTLEAVTHNFKVSRFNLKLIH